MRYGNASVPGLFKYDPGTQYEPGDFVVDAGKIYNPTEVTSTQPSLHPESWKLWFADEVATIDDYNTLVESGIVKDKIITLGLLKTVLNKYSHGILGDGVLSSVDNLINDPESNFGTYQVARNNPEISSFIPQTGMTSEFVILRQYTCKKEEKIYRTQELYDAEAGLVYFRGTSGGNELSDWKLTTYNYGSLAKKLSELINDYNNRLRYLENLESDLRDNFRFKKVSFQKGDTVYLTKDSSAESGYVKNLDSMFNFSISDNSEGMIVKNYQVSVNFSDGDQEIYITPEISLEVTISETSAEVRINAESTANLKITSIFYQEFYHE